jgi:hypothetical protein
MTPDEIIEVLQGFKAGRGWQFLSTANEWKTPILSSLDSMLHALYSGQTIRLAPLPDEITIPARAISAPLQEAPPNGATVFVAYPSMTDFYSQQKWDDKSEWHQRCLARGLIHSTAERAIAAAKAQVPHES